MPDRWIAVKHSMLQDTLDDLMGGVILKLDQLRKDLNTPAHADALAATSHTRSKARMFALDAAERIDRELNPRETVQAQTDGQGAREVDARELATILNLRAELAEWRKATMLDNQDTATPDHLRQLIQDMGDDAVRLLNDRNSWRAVAGGCEREIGFLLERAHAGEAERDDAREALRSITELRGATPAGDLAVDIASRALRGKDAGESTRRAAFIERMRARVAAAITANSSRALDDQVDADAVLDAVLDAVIGALP